MCCATIISILSLVNLSEIKHNVPAFFAAIISFCIPHSVATVGPSVLPVVGDIRFQYYAIILTVHCFILCLPTPGAVNVSINGFYLTNENNNSFQFQMMGKSVELSAEINSTIALQQVTTQLVSIRINLLIIQPHFQRFLKPSHPTTGKISRCCRHSQTTYFLNYVPISILLCLDNGLYL